MTRPSDREPPLDHPDLPFPLRNYQWQGVRFLLERDAALLADDMGLGKTVQVSVALSLLFQDGAVRRALVVVPASLRLNWERELQQWAPSLSCRRVQGDSLDRVAHYRLPVNVLIASYDQIRSDSMMINREISFDVVILDEAQRIKNAASKTAVACRTLQRKRSWALTGTPLENNFDELVSVFKFIRAGLLHSGLSRGQLHDRMKPHFLRRVKEEVFEQVPPILVQELHVELGGRQKQAYDREWASRYSASSDGQLLALITRLKQLCNFDAKSGESAKLDALGAVVEGLFARRAKAIVFSQYVETLNWLSRKLSDTIQIDLFHGGLSETDRDQVLSEFRSGDGPRMLLMSLGAGATGLNLQEAEMVVFFDRWWNPAVENQAVHRAYRFGRSTPLHVIRFLVEESIEERIQQVLEIKTDLFDHYVNSADSAAVAPFTKHELRAILGFNQ